MTNEEAIKELRLLDIVTFDWVVEPAKAVVFDICISHSKGNDNCIDIWVEFPDGCITCLEPKDILAIERSEI